MVASIIDGYISETLNMIWFNKLWFANDRLPDVELKEKQAYLQINPWHIIYIKKRPNYDLCMIITFTQYFLWIFLQNFYNHFPYCYHHNNSDYTIIYTTYWVLSVPREGFFLWFSSNSQKIAIPYILVILKCSFISRMDVIITFVYSYGKS